MEGIIKEIIQEGPTTVTLRVRLYKPVEFLAGQFFMIGKFIEREGDKRFVKRAYSSSSSPSNKELLDFTVREVKDGLLSPVLVNEVSVGDILEIEGPYGKFILDEEECPEKITLIGGGCGIAPLKSICLRAMELGIPVKLIYSERSGEELIYKKELQEFGDKISVNITITRPEKEWKGRVGRVNREKIEELIEPKGLFFVCGPTEMVKDVCEGLQEIGVKKEQIRKEQW